MSDYHAPVLIIGSGPAGYTAAIYAARALFQPILITGLQCGGQLMVTREVENYPGFADSIQGPWLMEQMARQAEYVGAQIIYDMITCADLSQRPFTLRGDSGKVYSGDTVIIATGAQARWLGLASEQIFMGSGVSACATCDGFFYRDKDVVVVGGGNTALEEALYLSHLAKCVTVVHRRNKFRAEKIIQNRLFARENVQIIWNHVVDEITGNEASSHKVATVTGVRLKNLKNGEKMTISAEGIFIAIGHAPSVSLFKDQLRQKKGGYLWTKANSTATSIAGVFAAGDISDGVFRQAITAAGSGCMAALEAEHFLNLQITPKG
ncbi:MAG: thioredoxin reductase (NADPH) [Candidatus Tokpelaia sp. JSC188]|nr:MAG: thioredoxin reductase (NADPH) [Candidatus Tokpelaia sp. JSC188]